MDPITSASLSIPLPRSWRSPCHTPSDYLQSAHVLVSLLPRTKWLLLCLLLIRPLSAAPPAPRAGAGWTVSLAADSPVVQRPICADFDPDGNLWVAESSGSNDNVQIQLREKPHRIVRLRDADGDGRFEQRTLFADHLMFPEGVLWHDGSLYVTAPPVIWKLTDADGDGRCDERQVWFDGQTLTGCANDLHGPYLGRDGWIYWCKGAFARQQHKLRDGREWTSRAAHVFRRHPSGGPIEPLMNGGMDNPVEIAFLPTGEPVITTTFLQHPAMGKRDGLLHIVYGGLYGKQHGVLDEHPHTGPVLPVLAHMGAAAPCGLALLETCDDLPQATDQPAWSLAVCQFNLHQVTCYDVVEAGASLRVANSRTLLESSDLDFHPTDVLQDADGSLLVLDTGGWYKLCCPTSQVHRPAVLGGIWRLKRQISPATGDPRGVAIAWSKLSAEDLCQLLGDPRPAVRERATRQIVRTGEAAVASLQRMQSSTRDERTRQQIVWAAVGIDSPSARQLVRAALSDPSAAVRQAALHGISLLRDAQSTDAVVTLLQSESDQNRRAAAESIGRLGDPRHAADLLRAVRPEDDRWLRHQFTYALYELKNVSALVGVLDAENATTQSIAVAALGEIRRLDADIVPPIASRQLDRAAIRMLLDSRRDARAAARALSDSIGWHGELIGQLSQRAREGMLASLSLERRGTIIDVLSGACRHQQTRQDLFDALEQAFTDPQSGKELRLLILDVLAQSAQSVTTLPETWQATIARWLSDTEDAALIRQAITCLAGYQFEPSMHPQLLQTLRAIVSDEEREPLVRADGAIIARTSVPDDLFDKLLASVDAADAQRIPVLARLAQVKLSDAQCQQLVLHLGSLGPMELRQVLPAFGHASSDTLQTALAKALSENRAAATIPGSELVQLLGPTGPSVWANVKRSRDVASTSTDEQESIESLLASLPDGDADRGRIVFFGARAACHSCHTVGYLGGHVGPDLTQIGRIRSRADLLESIVHPSASFVRSFEPYVVQTHDGRSFAGIVRFPAAERIEVIGSDGKATRLPAAAIERLDPSVRSVMPENLREQLDDRQLADLLAFLLTLR